MGPRQPVLLYLLELLEKAVCFCFCFCFLSCHWQLRAAKKCLCSMRGACLRLRPAQATPLPGTVSTPAEPQSGSQMCLHPTFTTAKTQKQAQCPVTEQKRRNTCTVISCSLGKEEILFITVWMSLEAIKLPDVRLSQEKYCTIPLPETSKVEAEKRRAVSRGQGQRTGHWL